MTTIAENDRITGPLQPAAGTTSLSTDFPVFEEGDLVVLRRAAGGDWQRLTAGIDYTLSGLGDDAGAMVSLAHPSVTGEEFLLVGAMQPVPGVRYTQGQQFSAAQTNEEIARLWAAIQELRRATAQDAQPGAQPLLMPPGEQAETLPARSDRAARMLGFDAAGKPVAMKSRLDGWRGEWAAGVDYQAGDVVSYGGSSWVAVADHTSKTGSPPPSGEWMLLAAKGDTNDAWTYADLRQIDDGSKPHVYIAGRDVPGDGGGGLFRWVSGDQGAKVAADHLSGVWVAPAADPTGSSGAWMRVHDGLLRVEWWGAKPNGTMDCLAAFNAARDYAYAELTSLHIVLSHGVYRVTDEISFVDAPISVCVEGLGKFSTSIYGDFRGPAKAIIHIGASANDRRVGGHVVRGLSLFANGVVGDPIGILDERSQQTLVEDVLCPGDYTTIHKAPRKLLNSFYVGTQVNNTDIKNVWVFAGYQPDARTVSGTVKFSLTAGSHTVTASEPVFTPDMVGELIVGGWGTDWISARIVSVQSATECTIDVPSRVTASNKDMRIGYLTGAMTAGSDELRLSHPVLTNDHVGYYVHVPKAEDRRSWSGTTGMLTAHIVEVTSPTTCRIETHADITVSNVPIVFAPAIFVGDPSTQLGEGRGTNDCSIEGQIEGYQAAAVVCNGSQYVRIRTKMHGEGIEHQRGLRCYFAGVFASILSVVLDDVQVNYNWLSGEYGTFYVVGGRGRLDLRGVECQPSTPLRNGKLVYCEDNVGVGAYIVVGDVQFFDSRYHDAGWSPYHIGTLTKTAVIQSGAVTANFDNIGNESRIYAASVSKTSSAATGDIRINDNSVYEIRNLPDYGMLVITSRNTDVDGVFPYKLSRFGNLIRKRTSGGLVDVSANNGTVPLTGTTGQAGKVTLSSVGDVVQVENRKGHTIEVSYYVVGGFG